MQQNSRVTAFTVSQLLSENQQGLKLHPTPPRLGVNDDLELTKVVQILVKHDKKKATDKLIYLFSFA